MVTIMRGRRAGTPSSCCPLRVDHHVDHQVSIIITIIIMIMIIIIIFMIILVISIFFFRVLVIFIFLMFMVMIVSGEDVIAWDHVGVQVHGVAESSDDLSPWIPPLFPASMTLLSPPPHPPNQTLNGWVKWWFKSMDPTLVPSINDAFVPPPPPQPNNQTLNGWVKWWFKSMDPTLVPSINDAFVPPTPPTKP